MLAVISLASAGLIGPEATLAMVLGANIGSAINPVVEGTGGDPVKLRLPIGNLATRLIGTAAVLPLLGPIAELLSLSGSEPGRMAANFHTGFNIAVAAIFIGLLPPIAKVLVRVLPEGPVPNDPAKPLYLDPAALRTPGRPPAR